MFYVSVLLGIQNCSQNRIFIVASLCKNLSEKLTAVAGYCWHLVRPALCWTSIIGPEH